MMCLGWDGMYKLVYTICVIKKLPSVTGEE